MIPSIAGDDPAGITAEVKVPGTIIPTQAVVRLTVACDAVKYYISIRRTPGAANIHFTNVLSPFRSDFEAFESLKKADALEVPNVKETDGDRKIIKWTLVFLDCMSSTYGVKGPLAYVLREEVEVKTEVEYPLALNAYYGTNGSLQE